MFYATFCTGKSLIFQGLESMLNILILKQFHAAVYLYIFNVKMLTEYEVQVDQNCITQ